MHVRPIKRNKHCLLVDCLVVSFISPRYNHFFFSAEVICIVAVVIPRDFAVRVTWFHEKMCLYRVCAYIWWGYIPVRLYQHTSCFIDTAAWYDCCVYTVWALLFDIPVKLLWSTLASFETLWIHTAIVADCLLKTTVHRLLACIWLL